MRPPHEQDLWTAFRMHVQLKNLAPGQLECEFNAEDPELVAVHLTITGIPVVKNFLAALYSGIAQQPDNESAGALWEKACSLFVAIGMSIGRQEGERDPLARLWSLKDPRPEAQS